MNKERPIAARQKSSGKRRLATAAAIATAAAATAAIVAPRFGNAESDIVGSVPTIESCAPAADKTQAIGRAVCGTAVHLARDVVANKAPEGAQITGTSQGFTTTLGRSTYTFVQKLARYFQALLFSQISLSRPR